MTGQTNLELGAVTHDHVAAGREGCSSFRDDQSIWTNDEKASEVVGVIIRTINNGLCQRKGDSVQTAVERLVVICVIGLEKR